MSKIINKKLTCLDEFDEKFTKKCYNIIYMNIFTVQIKKFFRKK